MSNDELALIKVLLIVGALALFGYSQLSGLKRKDTKRKPAAKDDAEHKKDEP